MVEPFPYLPGQLAACVAGAASAASAFPGALAAVAELERQRLRCELLGLSWDQMLYQATMRAQGSSYLTIPDALDRVISDTIATGPAPYQRHRPDGRNTPARPANRAGRRTR